MRIHRALPFALAALLFTVCGHSLLRATVIIQFTQQGSNVVATVSGTLNTTGLTLLAASYNSNPSSTVNPGSGTVVVGFSGAFVSTKVFSGFSGPSSFGTGIGRSADSWDSSGGFIDFRANATASSTRLFLPSSFLSGGSLSASDTWNNTTFFGLGLTAGTYTYTWSSDSIVVQIGPGAGAVPEPSTYAAMAGVAALGAAGWMKRRRKLAAA